jgi:sulfonate transport system substrate-binding protein
VNRLRTPLAALLLAAALAATALGCGADGDEDLAVARPASSPEGAKLRVGVQKDGIRAILEQSGQLENLPYEISFSTFAFGPPLVEAAGADKIDVAGVGSTPPIFGGAADADFRAIATIQYRNKKDDALLVPKGSDITAPEQLKGKTIAVAKGSSAHGLTLKLLNRIGLGPDDVKLNYLVPADALAAFSSGQVDAWATWYPYIAQAEAEGARQIAGGPPDEYGHSFEIASAKAVADPKRAAALKDYFARLRKAFAWGARNPDKWAAAWSEESGLPLDVTKVSVRERRSDIVPISDETIEHQQELADRLAEDKVLPGEIRFQDIVTQGLIEGGS